MIPCLDRDGRHVECELPEFSKVVAMGKVVIFTTPKALTVDQLAYLSFLAGCIWPGRDVVIEIG